MTAEEFERIKEAEKEHLRKLRELKQAVRGLERQKAVTGAVSDMTNSSRRMLDAADAQMEKLAMEAATSEARLEIAMEEAAQREAAQRREEEEEELRKLRAQELVRQMKGQMDAPQGHPQTAQPTGAPQPNAEKTIGPIGPSHTSEEEKDPFPQKTIGRMR